MLFDRASQICAGCEDAEHAVRVVLELGRVLAMPDIQTNRSVQFIFWNNEEKRKNFASSAFRSLPRRAVAKMIAPLLAGA